MTANQDNHFDFSNFKGFNYPTTTPVPDLVFDHIMQDLNESELKVLLYIIRRTFGFKRQTDNISLSQMADGIITKEGKVLDKGTGLNRRSVARALASLKEKNLIEAHKRTDPQKGNLPTTYALKMSPSPSDSRVTSPSGSGVTTLVTPESPTTNSITTNSTTTEIEEKHNNSSGLPPKKQDVVVALIKKGISKKVAQRLASRYNRERILEKISFLEYLQETDPKKVANPRGWLRRAIEEDYGKPDGYKSRAEREAEAAAAEQRRQAQMEQEALRAAQEAEKRKQEALTREEQLKPLREQYSTSEDEKNLWDTWVTHIGATDQMGAGLLRSSCELLSASQTQIVIWVANDYLKQKFQSRYAKTIRQLAARHFKIPLTQVNLEVLTTEDQPNDEE